MRLPVRLSMDVLYAVTYRTKPYCTLDSQNINGASFSQRDARLATLFSHSGGHSAPPPPPNPLPLLLEPTGP